MVTPDVPQPVPRGRHAPPLEVRMSVQRSRLFGAASTVFTRDGYAAATAEAIAREAGMSKATFYEHFANKEECIFALFDEAATEVRRVMATPSELEPEFDSYEQLVRARLRAVLTVLSAFPEQTLTLLVEIVAAGPEAARRRDEVLDLFASYLMADNAAHAPHYGAPVFRTQDDAFAVIGAVAELVSRQLRTGRPAKATDLEDVLTRVMLGTLDRGTQSS